MPASDASDDSDYDSDKNFDAVRSSDKPFLCGVVEGNCYTLCRAFLI